MIAGAAAAAAAGWCGLTFLCYIAQVCARYSTVRREVTTSVLVIGDFRGGLKDARLGFSSHLRQ